MASLTEMSILSRKAIRYGVYLLIFGIIARTLFNIGHSIYLKIFPPKPPGANFAFGEKLPRQHFPEKEVPENMQFKVETADGKFPVFANIAAVYQIPPIPQSLTALDDAKFIASSLGFDPNGAPLLESTPNVYLFHKKNQPANLTMNIITGVFSISYDIGQDPSVLLGIPPEEKLAGEQVKSLLANAKLVPPDLSDGRLTFQYLKAEGRNIVPADSLSDANLIKVNIYRKNYGPKGSEFPSETADGVEANVWVIMGGSRQIVSAEYHYYPIDGNKSGTYPIKKAEEAWEDLKNGKGFIANLGNNSDGNITVRKIYLGYYDWSQYQEYYQPVVVFEGDNEFLGYVPAITDQYYAESSSDQSK